MLGFGKFKKTTEVFILPNLNCVYDYLQTGEVNKQFALYDDKIILRHETSNLDNEKVNRIRLWKSKTFLNCWYNDMTSRNFIAALDFNIKKDFVKLEYFNVNDYKDPDNIYRGTTSAMTDKEIKDTKEEMIDYIKLVARKENKPKIIVDVHNNLRIFNNDYKSEGFNITERKCEDNPYWLEAEFILY